MNFNSMEIYINTLKKDKINDWFKIIYSFFGKFLCTEKLYILENYLNWKIVNIEKTLNKKLICIQNFAYTKKLF